MDEVSGSSGSGSTATSSTPASGTPQGSGTPPADQGQGQSVSQGQAPNVTGQASGQPNTQQAVGQGQPPPQKPVETGMNPEHASWLQSKGIDPTQPDISKLIDNARNAERALTQFHQQRNQQPPEQRIQQHQQFEQQAAQQQGQPPVELSPLQEFQEAHDYHVDLYCRANGVNSFDELKQVNPALAQQLHETYLEGRQKSWEAEQSWKQEQQQKAQEHQMQVQQFHQELANAENAVKSNMLQFGRDYPELQQHFKDYGVESMLRHMEDAWTVPRSFILAQPEMMKFFAQSVKAMDFMKNIETHKDNWRKDYEKNLKKQSSAMLPSNNAGQNSIAGKVAFAQSANHRGISIMD